MSKISVEEISDSRLALRVLIKQRDAVIRAEQERIREHEERARREQEAKDESYNKAKSNFDEILKFIDEIADFVVDGKKIADLVSVNDGPFLHISVENGSLSILPSRVRDHNHKGEFNDIQEEYGIYCESTWEEGIDDRGFARSVTEAKLIIMGFLVDNGVSAP